MDLSSLARTHGHRLLVVSVGKELARGRSVYEAARHSWRTKLERAQEVDFVLADDHGTIVGVFVPQAWHPATTEHFPEYDPAPGRVGFDGSAAPPFIEAIYIGQRRRRLRGDASACSYFPRD